ncbi:MAG: hypothetical protein ACM34F_11950, partial [Betaproteobacteria bacterium]
MTRSLQRVALAVFACAMFGTSTSAAAPIYATSLIAFPDVTPFGGGIVTGVPDHGGLWLGSTVDPPAALGSLTVGFAIALIDG